ncbi:MAG TPA: hypothetical protein VFH43_14545, partial [Candidatus Kapabacteria bacterium]|nr:hypothetical protein [Candidatus Kapabacteria bacterium]
ELAKHENMLKQSIYTAQGIFKTSSEAGRGIRELRGYLMSFLSGGEASGKAAGEVTGGATGGDQKQTGKPQAPVIPPEEQLPTDSGVRD